MFHVWQIGTHKVFCEGHNEKGEYFYVDGKTWRVTYDKVKDENNRFVYSNVHGFSDYANLPMPLELEPVILAALTMG